MKDVLFIRADGNGDIGLGHIMRSMTIASVFKDMGFECIYISSAPINKKVFDRYDFKAIEIDYPYDNKSIKEACEICELIKQKEAKYILVDSYYINNEYLEQLKKYSSIICINSTRYRLRTDFLINENIACDRDYFDDLYSGSDTKLLLGSEYSPIRTEFCNRKYRMKNKVKKILVTTGGGDQYNFMTNFLKKISKKGKYGTLNFLFISGGCNVHYEDLVKESNGLSNVIIVNDADNMAELMENSDLAISAGGTTVLELSVMGVPTIGIAVADDQVAGLSFMHHIGMICYAGRITEPEFWNNVCAYFDLLLKDKETRKQLSEQSKKCIDGKGAGRIYHQIVKGWRENGDRKYS